MTAESESASISGAHLSKNDFEAGELGVGYRHGLSERLDLVAEASLVSTSIKTTRTERPFFGDRDPYTVIDRDESSTEGRVAVGVRGQMADQLEGWAKAGYIGDGALDGGFVGTLGGQVTLGRVWGVVAEVEYVESWPVPRRRTRQLLVVV